MIIIKISIEIRPSSKRVLIQKLLVSKANEFGRDYNCNIIVGQK